MTQIVPQDSGKTAAAPRQSTPVEAFAHLVMGDKARRQELFRGLPAHIPPERFERNLYNLLMQKPEILQYDPRLVFREVSKAAALGLSLDPQFAEADIVPAWNPAARRAEPELRPRYKGLIKLARQSGEVANIYPGEVCQEDHFLAEEGTEKHLEHRPDYKRPRGEPICYYAVVIYKDGTKDFEVMDIPSIDKIREKSDSWRAFQTGKIKNTPWVSDKGEMSKKTVLKRLLKRVQQSSDLATALDLDHDRPPLQTIDVTLENPGAIEQAPRLIESRLDVFASQPVHNAAPASSVESPPPDAGKGAASDSASETSEAAPPVAPASSTDDAGAQNKEIPEKIRTAMEQGSAARASGYDRELPKKLNLVSKKDEAAAYLAGWDRKDGELAAEEKKESAK